MSIPLNNNSTQNSINIPPIPQTPIESNKSTTPTSSVSETTKARILTAEEIQNLSWLNTIPKSEGIENKSFNPNLFAHIAAAGIAGNSSYEGSSYLETIPSMIEALKASKIGGGYPDIITKLEKCASYYQEILTIIKTKQSDEYHPLDRKNALTNLSAKCAKDVANLQINDSLLFPGGWSNADGKGHAILYLIERKTKDYFTFTVINTGSGTEYHGGFVQESGQEKYQSFVTFTDVHLASLDTICFELLIGLQVIPMWDASVKIEPKHLYEDIIHKFTKTLNYNLKNSEISTPFDPITYPSLYIKPQRAGTCAMKSLLTAVHLLMLQKNINDPEKNIIISKDYKRFRFEYQRKTLLDACIQYLKADAPYNRSTHALITHASGVLANMSLKLDKEGMISPEELKSCEATLKDISNRLKKKKADMRAKKIPHQHTFPTTFNNLNDCADGRIVTQNYLSDEKTYSIDFSLKNNAPEIPKNISPKTGCKVLSAWSRYDISTELPNKLGSIQTKAFNQIRQFPIPSSDAGKKFWEQIPEADIETCLEGLKILVQPFLMHSAQNDLSQKTMPIFLPSYFIEIQTALAIADFLARREKANLLNNFKLPNHQLLHFATSPLTVLKNPKDQTRLSELLKYFAPEADLREMTSESCIPKPNESIFCIPWNPNFTSCNYNEITSTTIEKNAEQKYYRQFLVNASGFNSFRISLARQVEILATESSTTNPLIPKSAIFLKNIALMAQLIPSTIERRTITPLPMRNFEFHLQKFEQRDSITYDLEVINDDVQNLYKSNRVTFQENIHIDVSYSRNVLEPLMRRKQNQFLSDHNTILDSDRLIKTVNAHDEAIRALAYLESNPIGELEDPEKQTILLVHLLRPEVLLPQITQEPRVGLKILEILKKQLDYFYHSKKYTTCLFLANLANRCQDYLNYSKAMNPENFAEIKSFKQVDYRQWIIENLIPENRTEEFLYKTYKVLSNMPFSKLSYMPKEALLEDFAEDWYTYAILKNLQIKQELSDPFSFIEEFEENLLANDLMPHLSVLLENNQEFRNRILNTIVTTLTNTKQELSWKGTYPVFEAPHFQFNAQDNTLNGKSAFINLIPQTLVQTLIKTSSPNLFGKIEKSERISSDEFNVFDQHGKTHILRNGNKVCVKRTIDGKEYYLLNTLGIESSNYTKSKSYYDPKESHDLFPFFVQNDSILWLGENLDSILLENSDNRKYFVKLTKIDSRSLSNESLKKDRWLIPLDNALAFQINSICHIGDNSRIMISSSDIPEFSILKNFAEKNSLAIWAKDSLPHKLDEVELFEPRKRFILKKNEKGVEHLYSYDEPEFFISSDQLDENRKNWPPYIVMENALGKRKVLMKQMTIQQNPNKDFEPTFTFTTIPKVIEYDLEKKSDKWGLKPRSIFDAIHLASVHLTSKHYRQAFRTLKDCYALRKYTKDELNLIKSIICSDPMDNVYDDHPKAVCCRLKLALMALENDTKFTRVQRNYFQGNPLTKDVFNDYLKYLNNQSNSRFYSLSQDEENILMKIFKNDYSIQKLNHPQLMTKYSSLVQTEKNQPISTSCKYTAEPQEEYTANTTRKKFETYLSPSAYDRFKPFAIKKEYNDYKRINLNYSRPPLPYSNISTIYIDNQKELENNLLTIDKKKILIADIPLSKDLNFIDDNWHLEIDSMKNTDIEGLKEKHITLIQSLFEEEKTIVALANEYNELGTTTDALQQLARVKLPLSFEKILSLFVNGNLKNYQDKSFLSEAQVLRLDSAITQYLMRSINCAQLKRIIELKEKFSQSLDEEEKHLISSQIEEEFKTKRHYNFRETQNHIARSFLALENQNNIFLRDKQTNTVNMIALDKLFTELLLELGTGTGKSKVLAPLFELLRQKGKLVFNLWPTALFKTNREDMKKLVGEAFGQDAIVFKFNRRSLADHENLVYMLHDFARAIVEGKQINTTPESLQCLELKFLEFVNEIANDYLNTLKFNLMQQIMELIRTSEFHIDEAHINLSPKREVNYTIGEPATLPVQDINFVEEIFRILTSEEANATLGLKEDKQRFATNDEVKVILTKLAAHFEKKLGIPEQQKQSYISYVLGGDSADWMYAHPEKEKIVLLREHLTKLLPTIFTKSVNVNFGLSHKYKNVKYAKPYHGNDSPIENAEFENILETLAKTHLIYIYQGLSVDDLWDIIQHLQNRARQQSLEMELDISGTPAYKEFLKLFGNILGNLNSVDKKAIEFHHDKLRYSPEPIFYFVSTIVAPTIIKYPKKFKSTPQDLLNMSKSFIAMSATPGSSDIYRQNIDFRHPAHKTGEPTSDFKTLAKFEKDNGSIHIIDGTKPSDLLEKTLLKMKGDIRMLIDAGALFKGLSNRYVAEKILQHQDAHANILGVIFFDEKDRMLVLKKLDSGQFEAVPIEQCSLPPKQRITYCDQRHAFGTDTKQYVKAKSIVTFDTLTTTSDLIQGIGRLRQFLSGQSVEMLLTSKTKSMIKPTGDLSLQDIIQYANANQDDELDNFRLRSLFQQMNGEVRNVMIRELSKSNMNIEEICNIYTKYQTFLIENVDYSNDLPSKEKLKEIASSSGNPLLDHCNNLIKKTKDNGWFSKDIEEKLIRTLEAYKVNILAVTNDVEKHAKQRNKPSNLRAFEAGTEVEVQNENNVNTNKELNVDVELATEDDSKMQKLVEDKWPMNFDFYNPNWLPMPQNPDERGFKNLKETQPVKVSTTDVPNSLTQDLPSTTIKQKSQETFEPPIPVKTESKPESKIENLQTAKNEPSSVTIPVPLQTMQKTQKISRGIFEKAWSSLSIKAKVLLCTVTGVSTSALLATIIHKVMTVALPLFAALPFAASVSIATITAIALVSLTGTALYFIAKKRLNKPDPIVTHIPVATPVTASETAQTISLPKKDELTQPVKKVDPVIITTVNKTDNVNIITTIVNQEDEQRPEVIEPEVYFENQTPPYDPTQAIGVPLFDMKKILGDHKLNLVSQASPLFASTEKARIFFTNNFMRLIPKNKNEYPLTPLSKAQRTAYEVLLVQDIINDKKRWTVIVGDQSTDAKDWRENLNKITPEQAKGQTRRICLYDLALGIAKDSPNQFNEDELTNDEELQALIAKVKLYNGNVTYTKAQRKGIEKMTKNPDDRSKLKNFFQRAIIWHRNSRKLYKGSWLQSTLCA